MQRYLDDNPDSYISRIPFTKGMIITFWGIVSIFLFRQNHFLFIKAFGVLNLITAFLTILFTVKFSFLKISKQWLLLEAGIEIVAGFVCLFLADNTAEFLHYISIGIIFIVILQFTYGYALLMSGEFNLMNIIFRIITLIAGANISVLIFSQKLDTDIGFLIVGLFSVIYGIINMQYSVQLRNDVLGSIK